MSFTSGEVTLFKVGGGQDTYVVGDVRSLHFKRLATAVEEIIPAPAHASFQVFPNPFSGLLNIQLSSPISSAGRIEIISLEGRLVHSLSLHASEVLYQVHLPDLAKGLYICRVQNGVTIETRKIIKQ
jgi:hypothetical protein